jgi:hypothetical protein
MWQADITHWQLAGEGHAEILNMIDDHSRLFLASRAFPTTKAADVVGVLRSAIDLRIRHDKVDSVGKVSLRHDSKLHHIGLGRAHKGKTIKLLVADRDIRVLDAQTGLIRRLTIDPSRDYQPIGGS